MVATAAARRVLRDILSPLSGKAASIYPGEAAPSILEPVRWAARSVSGDW